MWGRSGSRFKENVSKGLFSKLLWNRDVFMDEKNKTVKTINGKRLAVWHVLSRCTLKLDVSKISNLPIDRVHPACPLRKVQRKTHLSRCNQSLLDDHILVLKNFMKNIHSLFMCGIVGFIVYERSVNEKMENKMVEWEWYTKMESVLPN